MLTVPAPYAVLLDCPYLPVNTIFSEEELGMQSTYFGVALFLALVVLAKWKRRHDQVARMNRGLTSYVTMQKAPAREAEGVKAA